MNRHIATTLSLLAFIACGGDPSTKQPAPSNVAGAPAIGGCLGKKCGPTNDVFFSNDNYGTLKLTFTPEDLAPLNSTPDQWEDLLWSKWNSQCGNFEWVPANMEYLPGDGSAAWHLNRVAMRMRGSKSRGSNPLAGFKLDYNKLLPPGMERLFGDMKRFDLLSNEKDATGLIQCLTYQLMRDFGIPAPKCNHVEVVINGKVYGLMESIEGGRDKAYLSRHYDNPEGPLFGVSASSVVCGYPLYQGDLEYKGDSFSGDYLKIYQILRGTPADAESDLIPLLKCGDNLATPSDADFRTCIKDWIHLDEWLKLIAAESLVPTVEDFIGSRRNFYLYFEPDDFAPKGGRMRIWGWDYDTAFNRQQCYPGPATVTAPTCADPFKDVASWYGPRGRRQNLVMRLTNVFRQEYCGFMKEFLDTVYLPEKVDRMAAVIEPAMVDDPTMLRMKAESGWDWPTDIANLHDFMVKRRATMQGIVASLCSSTVTPPSGVAGAAGAAGASGAAGAAGASGDIGAANAGAGGAGN